MDRDRNGSPLMSRQKSGAGSASPGHPSAHHARSSSTGITSVRKSQNYAARAAAQRLAQAMASQSNEDDEEDDLPFLYESKYRNPARATSSQLSRTTSDDSSGSLRSATLGRPTIARPTPLVPAPLTSNWPRNPLPSLVTQASPDVDVSRIGRFPDVAQEDRREAASLNDKIDLLEEEKEDLLDQLRNTEERWKEAEAKARELEKQVASLGEGISLEARLLSRKEAALRQREAALKAEKQTKDVRDDEIAALRLDVEAAKDEAAAAVEQARNAESETRSLRTTTQRMILTQEEMEEVVLKRCWLARYWSLAVRHGVHPEIAGAKQDHWSSLAPLPLEVVLSAGQKAKEEPSMDEENGAGEKKNQRRVKFTRDLNDISGEGNIESMLSVEKGLRELTALKVEDAVMLTMAQHRRPSLVRVGQAFPEPVAMKSVDSPKLVESFELSPEEVEDVQFKQSWLVYFWRRAKNNGVEEDIADERLQYWIGRNNQNATSQDAVDVERGLMEMRKLDIENQLWEASRKEIQEIGNSKSRMVLDAEGQSV